MAGSDEQKRTNETGMAVPLLTTCDIAGKDITGDALLTQRTIATQLDALRRIFLGNRFVPAVNTE